MIRFILVTNRVVPVVITIFMMLYMSMVVR